MPHKPQPLSSTAWLLFVGAGGGDGGGGEGGGGGDGGAASVQACSSGLGLTGSCFISLFLFFLLLWESSLAFQRSLAHQNSCGLWNNDLPRAEHPSRAWARVLAAPRRQRHRRWKG